MSLKITGRCFRLGKYLLLSFKEEDIPKIVPFEGKNVLVKMEELA